MTLLPEMFLRLRCVKRRRAGRSKNQRTVKHRDALFRARFIASETERVQAILASIGLAE